MLFRSKYERGRQDRFDRQGRLISTEISGALFKIDRSDPARIQIAASNGKPLTFEFAVGHVVRITENGAILASYEYNRKGELAKSRDEAGSVAELLYEEGGMTRITTDGKVTNHISYYPAAKFRSVKSYEGPEIVAEYDYDFSRREHGITTTFFTAHSPGDPEVVLKRKTEYCSHEGLSGNSYLYRTIETETKSDRFDLTTITDYNELGLPTLLRKSGKEQRLAYDSWGRVVRKETDDLLTELAPQAAERRARRQHPIWLPTRRGRQTHRGRCHRASSVFSDPGSSQAWPVSAQDHRQSQQPGTSHAKRIGVAAGVGSSCLASRVPIARRRVTSRNGDSMNLSTASLETSGAGCLSLERILYSKRNQSGSSQVRSRDRYRPPGTAGVGRCAEEPQRPRECCCFNVPQ